MNRPWQSKRLLVCLLGLTGLSCQLRAQDVAPFEKTSEALRTALHFDPAADAPLRSLIAQYQQAGKITELVSLYETHLAQFPNDEGAKAVLGRLFVTLRDARADKFLDSAVATHPKNALLAFIRSQVLSARFAPGALEELDRAVALERGPSRRSLWLGELFKAAAAQQRDDLVATRLKALVTENSINATQRIHWARRALEYGLIKAADAVLEGFNPRDLQGEAGVDARFVMARVALANDRRAEAAQFANQLLDLLAADHWRRQEALALRWQTAADDIERAKLLNEAALRVKTGASSEADALAYSDLLLASGRRMEALTNAVDAAVALPSSQLLEERVFDLSEQLHQHDRALAFLVDRLRQSPERTDLALRQARLLLTLGRTDEGLATMDAVLAKAGAAEQPSIVLQTARWLRSRNLLGEASQMLTSFLSRSPNRWDIRRELAEQLALLKRRDEVERLFEAPMPDDIAPELRMEVVQFLLSQNLWRQARRELEQWVDKRAADFDARILLAKVCALQGDHAAAAKALDQCRTLADTDARYAAWLNAAWTGADEQEKTIEFIQEERQRLAPKTSETWDAARLAKWSIFAEQTAQQNLLNEAERLVRDALASPALPPDSAAALQDLLIRVLSGQKERAKDLESEITKMLQIPKAPQDDLRLRLALMYHGSQRRDLASRALELVDPAGCQDLGLISRAAAMARDLGLQEPATGLYERLVRLKPDERNPWLEWTTLLSQAGDEEGLRGALREIDALTAKWQLSAESQELVRRHLAASYWRSIARLLAAEPTRDADVLALLDEVERTELAPQRQLWAAWIRGMIARRSGSPTSLADIERTLAGSKQGWVDFPDGLSLSIHAATRVLRERKIPTNEAEPATAVVVAPMQSPTMAWGFAADSGAALQRWEMTPNGKVALVMDARRTIYALDRPTGKVLWKRRIVTSEGNQPSVAPVTNRGSDEQIAYPAEWAIANDHLCLLDDGVLVVWRLQDGALLWRAQAQGGARGTQGCIAIAGDSVLWWQPQAGVVDAFDLQSGRLCWTQRVPALSQPPKGSVNQPTWLAAGIDTDLDHALIWGNGAAVLAVKTGSILWRASATTTPIGFPLELRTEGETTSSATTPAIVSSISSAPFNRGFSPNHRSAGGSRTLLANPLAVPSYGYPGMYGGQQTSPWLTWGTDGTRRLRGEGVWVISQQAGAVRYSAFGLPLASRSGGAFYGYAFNPVGFAGKGLILAGESTVVRALPDGTSLTLLSLPRIDNQPSAHPMPAVALQGTTVLIATRDMLRTQDAISGQILWEGKWGKEALSWCQEARDGLGRFQSMRWSTRGISFHDGQNRTLTVDWKALAADGDWIIPAGVTKLVCLRTK